MSLHQVSPTSLLTSSSTSGGSGSGNGNGNPRNSLSGPPLLPAWTHDNNNNNNDRNDDDDLKSLSSCSDTAPGQALWHQLEENNGNHHHHLANHDVSQGTITFEPPAPAPEDNGAAAHTSTHTLSSQNHNKAAAFAPTTTTNNNTTTTTTTNNTTTTTTTNNNTTNNTTNNSGGFYLRWSRLHKVVEVKSESNSGLLRSNSISASLHAGKHRSPSSLAKQMNQNATTNNTKVILNQVSGSAAPGELLACMGPSGSGKTSLMNVLSGRSSYQQGTISINGEPLNSHHSMKRLMAKVAYVKQSDIFFGHLTVRDQFTYTALLRLPADTSPADKHAQVDQLVRLLRLNKVESSPIRMLSGGEKKRVNIGTELLTNPAVILLDEPTSGLDSTSAVSLLKLLHKLARDQQKTILTSIHQPSSSIFMSFTKLLLLSEGNVVYFGPPRESLEYLASPRIQLPCPPGYNAADHWMDLLVIDTAVEEERMEQVMAAEQKSNGVGGGGVRQRNGGEGWNGTTTNGTARTTTTNSHHLKLSPRLLLQQAWDNEAVAEQLDLALTSPPDDASITMDTPSWLGGAAASKYPTTWWQQFGILIHRALKNSHSAIFTWLNMTKSLAIGVVTGLLWFRTQYTESRVQDIRSYYFFTMTFWVFDSMFNSLMSFPAEREVILKERASGSYRLSAYFMAKVTSDAPVRVILPLLYMIVSYWMAGFDYRFSIFIGSCACTLLSVVAGEAIGLCIGAAIYDLQKAMTFMTVFALALMLLGGFFVGQVPIWIAWAKYLSPFKYAFDSSLQIVFDRPVPCDGSNLYPTVCTGNGTTGYIPARTVLDSFRVQGSIGFNIGLLVVICLVPRYFAYVALRMKKGGERS